jgi:two-component system response regulator FixJ
MTTACKRVFFVDDEPAVCKAVELTLRRCYSVKCFVSARRCLNTLRNSECDLLITDVNMPDMDGIELLKEAKKLYPTLPVLVVTGYGDIPLAVRAVKSGAENFIEKPLQSTTLLRLVETALKKADIVNPLTHKKLTAVELKVLKLLVAGKSNKEIARLLNRSIRTIEDHRSHIMCKLGACNIVDLVKMATSTGLVTEEQKP